MSTPTEQIQTNIPSYLKDSIVQLVAKAQELSQQGYQPYAKPKFDAQGNPVYRKDAKGDPILDSQGNPIQELEGLQRTAGFNPAQIAAFNQIAAMQKSGQLDQATGLAGLAGIRAGELSKYTPASQQQFYESPQFREMGLDYLRTQAAPTTQYQMATPERVGVGALQQYRMGAPERIAGPTGPERVSGPQLQQFQMSPAQQVRVAELERLGMVAPRDVAAQQLQQFQMGPAERVGAGRVNLGSLQAAQTGYRPDLQAFEMGPAERVGAERFGLGAMQEYMSPYMQGVVNAQKRAAEQDYLRQLPGIGAAAARAGGRGGTREALLQSEARRSLAERLSDIEATGLQSAYQQAAQQFGQDRAAQMQAALANQQAGLTTGQQNLQSRLGVQQLGTQIGLQTALANLTNEQQARVQQEANRLQASGMNQQSALQAALANQQATQQTQQQNLAAQLQTQGLSAEQAMRAALANQQMGYNVGAFNVGAEQQRQQLMAQQQLEAQRLNQAAGLTTGQQNLAAQLQTQGLSSQQALEIARLNQQGQLSTEQLRSEIARANQAAGMTAEQANQQAALAVQQLGTQSGLQAALANQQAGMQTGQTNLQALINQAQFGAGQSMQAQQANQQAQLQAQQQALAQLASANQFGLQNAAQRAQYGLAGANLVEQSRQFGAGMGMQGLQQQLAAAGMLGNLGMQDYQQQMGINAAQLSAGGQQQALEQELLNTQYQDFLNQQRLPYQQAEFLSGILRGLPATGQTQTMYQAPGSMFGQIAGIGLGVGSLFGGLGNTTGGGGSFGGRP